MMHFRMGPIPVPHPIPCFAKHIARAMEEHIAWPNGSAILPHCENFGGKFDMYAAIPKR